MKVLIADKLDAAVIDESRQAGLAIDDRAGIDAAELREVISGYEALVVRSRSKVTEDLLAAAPGLRVVGRAGTGVDNIDVAAATRRGVLVMNTPGGNSNSAAEHSVAMMFALARKISPAHSSLQAGDWAPKRFTGVELFGKTLGIIGLGRIGLLVAEKARGLGMTVVGYDPVIAPELAERRGIRLSPLEDVAVEADYLSVHVPLIDATRHIVGADFLNRAKPGLRVVNCARGGVVDETALLQALENGQVAGAALDVFEKEPPSESPLVAHPEVLCTPHLGASTVEAQEVVARAVLRQIQTYLGGGEAVGALNGFSLDPATREEIAPFLELSQRLGRIAAGVGMSGAQLETRAFGETLSKNARALSAFFLRGYLSAFMDGVNEVNAPALARERGIEIQELTRRSHKSFQALVSFAFDGGDAIAGTLFGRSNLRLVRLGGMNLDAIPEGPMLAIRNQDQPGVIGRVGAAIGDAGINIANMSLGRSPERGALALLNLDDELPASVLATIGSWPDIDSVDQLRAN